MGGGEQDAQERLRQAQESRREAVEGVREAQEGVREMKERVGDDSRQSSEVDRASGEGGRTVAERGRVSAEDLRGAAENVRELAEGGRAVAQRGAAGVRMKLKVEFYAIYFVLFLCGVAAAFYGERQDQRITDVVKANRQTIGGLCDSMLPLREIYKARAADRSETPRFRALIRDGIVAIDRLKCSRVDASHD